jgi:hypothetical protein
MSYINFKYPFKTIKESKGAEPNIVEAWIDDKVRKIWLDAFQYKSLLLGKKLRVNGVSQELLNELNEFIEEYGDEMREEGLSSCCGIH